MPPSVDLTSHPLPDTRRAAAIDRYGGADEISIKTLPMPKPDAGQVLFRVHTAGLGPWDPRIREGKMQAMMEGQPQFPYVLGSEGAGTVAAVGAGVTRVKVGDRIWAVAFLNESGGFFADYGLVRADYTAPVPAGLALDEAGAMGVDALTASSGLRSALKLQAGETLMVYGASGGIGHIAVQFAKRLGARVLAVASGEDGVRLVQSLGADAAVDGKSGDVAAAAQAFAPDGIDAALVTASSDTAAVALAAVRAGGRIAWPNGVTPAPETPPGVDGAAFDGETNGAALDAVNRLIAQDGGGAPFRIHVARTFALDAVADAQRALAGHIVGKLAVSLGG